MDDHSKLTRKELLAKSAQDEKLVGLLEEFDELTVSEMRHAQALRRLTSHLHLNHRFLAQVGDYQPGD